MSQSLVDDFPIDPLTTSGDELADILNRFEQAVNSSNSGAAAPPSTATGMFWLDTSGASPVLKIRNAANSGWINLMTMDPAGGGGMSSLFADGTQAAPAIAWASEPGLGWFRSNGVRRFVQGGSIIESINATAAAATYWALNPRGPGLSSISLSNAAPDALNANAFVIQQQADGSAFMQGSFTGTATAKSFNFTGWSILNALMTMQATAFQLDGNSRWTQDGSNVYHSFNPDWFLYWYKPNGQLTWRRPGNVNTVFSPNGDFHGGGDIYTQNSGGLALIASSAGNPYLRLTTDGWKLLWNSGSLYYQHPDGTSLVTMTPGGDISAKVGSYAGQQFGVGASGAITTFSSSQINFNAYQNPTGGVQQAGFTATPAGMTEQLEFRHNPGVYADIYLGIGSGTFTFDNNGQAAKSSGAGQWNGTSDIRLKEDVAPLPYGLNEVLQLQPIVFRMKPGGDVVGDRPLTAGLSAQATEPIMPLMIYKAPNDSHPDLGDVYGMRPDFVQYAMVNAIKTLEARLRALEGNHHLH